MKPNERAIYIVVGEKPVAWFPDIRLEGMTFVLICEWPKALNLIGTPDP